MEGGPEQAWRRTVGVVWVAVVLAMMGMSLVMPFLPLYLTELGVPAPQTKLWAGWIGGANFLFAALFAPLWGHLADRYGRKRMALRALVGLALSAGLMGFAQNAWQLLGLRVLQGMFGGFVAEAIALVGTAVPRERTGAALGFLQTGVVIGGFVGPLAGGMLSHFFGYRSTFRITGVALLAAMLLIALLVRETRRDEPAARRSVAEGVRSLLAIPALRWLVLTVLLSQAAMMLVNPQISLFVKELAPGETVDLWTGLVTAAPALSSCVMATVWGRLGDRRGHAGVLSLALLGAGLCAPWAGLAGAAWVLVLLRLGMGGFTSALNPSNHSIAAHSVEPARLAGAFSLVSSAQMLGACLGPFASGPLAATFGLRALFPLSGLLLLAAALGAARVARAGRGAGAVVQ